MSTTVIDHVLRYTRSLHCLSINPALHNYTTLLLPKPTAVGAIRAFSIPRSGQRVPSTKRRLTGKFGNEWWGGHRPTDYHAGYSELPKPPYDPRPYRYHFERYNGIASGLGAEYYFRPDQKHQLSYFHMRSPKLGDMVAVGATDPRAALTRTIDNYVKERTRGFAVQILLNGRGVKAWWETEHPELRVRLGVGTKTLDLKEYCERDPDIRIHVNDGGNIIVVHGPNKSRVGVLAYRLLRKMQPRLMPYTGKGAHFAFFPRKTKTVRKK